MSKLLVGINDLATINPSLADEWHYQKNLGLLPSQVTTSSNKKVWWQCSQGHEWQAIISDRNRGRGCPYCSNRKIIVGYNDLATSNPELCEEWDYNKNDKTPEQVTSGSRYRAWWICNNCGNSWAVAVSARSKHQHQCPACAKEKAGISIHQARLKHGVSLLFQYPDIAKEWHPSKNETLLPSMVTPGTHRKVWWLGKCGHEWESSVSNRVSGNGCPYCAGQKVLSGYNDLCTVFPNIASEWDYEKNTDTFPNIIAPGSNKKVWWICKYGHEWLASPNARTSGNIIKGCPECSKYRHTSFPEKIIYYYLRNFYSDIKINYRPQCMNGKELDLFIPEINTAIEYDGQAWHTDNKKDLVKDALLLNLGIRIIRFREPHCKTLNDNSICIALEKTDSNYFYMEAGMDNLLSILGLECDINIQRDTNSILQLSDINYSEKNTSDYFASIDSFTWHPSKNGKLSLNDFTIGSQKKVWWLGKCGHEWESSITNARKNHGCPYCSGIKVLPGFNDLATTHPILVSEWNYEKNIYNPTEISMGSEKKVWWICKYGHEWEASPNNRTNKNSGCPVCNNKQVLSGYNDLKTLFPHLGMEWDYDLNEGKIPENILPGSGVKYWWICPLGHKYQTSPKQRVRGCGCPICSGKKVLPGYNDVASNFPALVEEWHPTKNKLKPSEVAKASSKKVWWVCKAGHEWETIVSNRTTNNSGCPYCAKLNRHTRNNSK